MSEFQYKKILIYGVTGSGKTTFAARLSKQTGLPWHSVDDLAFKANWIPTPAEEQREKIIAICNGDRWILDTAYGTWIDVPLTSTDLIVALDYPRWLSLGRLLRRTIKRLFDKTPICNGNRESLRLMLSRDSILLWHFRSFRRKHDRIAKWVADPDGPRVVHIRTALELENWIAGF